MRENHDIRLVFTLVHAMSVFVVAIDSGFYVVQNPKNGKRYSVPHPFLCCVLNTDYVFGILKNRPTAQRNGRSVVLQYKHLIAIVAMRILLLRKRECGIQRKLQPVTFLCTLCKYSNLLYQIACFCLVTNNNCNILNVVLINVNITVSAI